MSIEEIVYAVFKQVAAEQGKTLPPLNDRLPLADCGLDSLSFAIVVMMLEDRLNMDPFSSSEHVNFPVTLGDFIRFYDRAAA